MFCCTENAGLLREIILLSRTVGGCRPSKRKKWCRKLQFHVKLLQVLESNSSLKCDQILPWVPHLLRGQIQAWISHLFAPPFGVSCTILLGWIHCKDNAPFPYSFLNFAIAKVGIRSEFFTFRVAVEGITDLLRGRERREGGGGKSNSSTVVALPPICSRRAWRNYWPAEGGRKAGGGGRPGATVVALPPLCSIIRPVSSDPFWRTQWQITTSRTDRLAVMEWIVVGRLRVTRRARCKKKPPHFLLHPSQKSTAFILNNYSCLSFWN